MTLRPTLFTHNNNNSSSNVNNTGFKQQEADTIDFDLGRFGASTVSPLSFKRLEGGGFVLDVQKNRRSKDVDSQQSHRAKDKDTEQRYMTTSKGAAAELVQADHNSRLVGGVLSPVRPMGGEGTPVKGKPLSADTMENPQMALNNNNTNNKDGGGAEDSGGKGGGGGVVGQASIELSSSEGKWRGVRKSPSGGGGGGGAVVHAQAGCLRQKSPSSAAHTQASCLRQILLLQLDLIETQQAQLQAKDREIDELKADKDTLLARIERMERRLQLTKKDPPRDKRLFQPLEPWTPDKEDVWDLDTEESPQPNQATPMAFGRGGKGQKRKSCFGDTKGQKSRGKSSKLSPLKAEATPGSPHHRELRSKETPEKSLLPARTDGREPATACKEEPDLSCQMDELPFMSTTEMYLCCWNQPPLSPLRETSPKKEEEVAIPSWRENHIEPLEDDDSCTLTEPMDDGVFLKRHSKLELDEKRRKRWDIQRIREQRMFQRLQQRMNRKKIVPETEPELSSFYPDTEDVETIVITPFLPVVAFGRPLPKLSHQNFELPWLDDRSRCRIEVPKKHTPHRTCRK